MLMICLFLSPFCLSVERSQGIVLLETSSLCLLFLLFIFLISLLGFRHEVLKKRACVLVRDEKKTVLLSCTSNGLMGSGAYWVGWIRDRDTKDRHNSNLQRMFYTLKLTLDPFGH
jgi:hypothetical protein